jgi:hypothetical protein
MGNKKIIGNSVSFFVPEVLLQPELQVSKQTGRGATFLYSSLKSIFKIL